jgi:hypothetical protein
VVDWWLVHAHSSEPAALQYVLSTHCRLCMGVKVGLPTQFNTATGIACSAKLTSKPSTVDGLLKLFQKLLIELICNVLPVGTSTLTQKIGCGGRTEQRKITKVVFS